MTTDTTIPMYSDSERVQNFYVGYNFLIHIMCTRAVTITTSLCAAIKKNGYSCILFITCKRNFERLKKKKKNRKNIKNDV